MRKIFHEFFDKFLLVNVQVFVPRLSLDNYSNGGNHDSSIKFQNTNVVKPFILTYLSDFSIDIKGDVYISRDKIESLKGQEQNDMIFFFSVYLFPSFSSLGASNLITSCPNLRVSIFKNIFYIHRFCLSFKFLVDVNSLIFNPFFQHIGIHAITNCFGEKLKQASLPVVNINCFSDGFPRVILNCGEVEFP